MLPLQGISTDLKSLVVLNWCFGILLVFKVALQIDFFGVISVQPYFVLVSLQLKHVQELLIARISLRFPRVCSHEVRPVLESAPLGLWSAQHTPCVTVGEDCVVLVGLDLPEAVRAGNQADRNLESCFTAFLPSIVILYVSSGIGSGSFIRGCEVS